MSNTNLWYTRCPVPTAFSLAIRLGWLDQEFAADGISITSLLQSSDRNVRESHFSHTQANSFRHGGNAPPIWARSVGSDVKLIGLSWTDAPQVLLTLPGSGIKSVADLKGRRLALPRRTLDSIDFARSGTLQSYETALATAGLTLKDVELVEIVVDRGYLDDSGSTSKDGTLFNAFQNRSFQREEIAAFLQGKVDVISSNGPRAVDFQALLGAQVIYDAATNPNRLAWVNNSYPYTFTVSGKLLEEQPELVTRLLVKTLEAAEWAKSHHSDAVRIVALELGVAEEFVERSFGPNLSQQFDVNFSPENVAALRLRKEFLLKHGFLGGDFDIDQWIVTGPLEEAKRIVAAHRKQTATSKPKAQELAEAL
ncbi:MAG: hypothetical protein B9S32_01175 [Verrucomicrobia bacterium Tous-C9LFEB]|nr:MAG: hypothetical protein B9S32_01175 [Verrucomicrobia bacterium Tous-C9LFEB]